MRKNFSDVALYPQPVLVIATYDEYGVPNAMNVAWGGLCGSKYVDINISRGHKTTENILLKKPVVNKASQKLEIKILDLDV